MTKKTYFFKLVLCLIVLPVTCVLFSEALAAGHDINKDVLYNFNTNSVSEPNNPILLDDDKECKTESKTLDEAYYSIDTDGDGIVNKIDIDDDNDGVSDAEENLLDLKYTNPNVFLKFHYNATWLDFYEEGIMVRLTKNRENQSGSVMSKDKISLNHDFRFEFDIKIGSNDNGADGIAFILHKDPMGQATIGTYGAGLGAQGIANGIALEFDVYNNGGGEPATDHMSMWDSDTGSISPTGLWTQHPDDISATGHLSIPNIEDSVWRTVVVEYTAATSTIQYTLDGTHTLQSVAGIKNYFLDGEDYAYFGWSGSTGSISNDQYFRLHNIEGVTTITIDKDEDGIPNYLDLDSDNDGIPDAYNLWL